MKKSYSENYIKIYLWQALSLMLNFLSLFIVVPYLTSEPTVYGIYSVCISFSFFLAYADLGFMSAGQKYASECYARGDFDEEVKIVGFTNFILLIILSLFTVFFFILSQHPSFIFKGIVGLNQSKIASSLLLILALFTPVTFLQRLLQMIFGIRLEDYIVQRTNIIGNLIKIFSVLWFFGNGKYDIVGYFLFVQVVNFSCGVTTLIIARNRYNYGIVNLFKCIKFDRFIYNKTKRLAFTSLYLTLTWIVYYEIDSIAIAKLFGAKQVAIFAIGATVLTFFRSLFGILFSPFNVRFNHFIGNQDMAGLKSLFISVTKLTLPLTVYPVLTIFLISQSFILTWVGENYIDSIIIVQFLILGNVYSFITYPTSLLLVAQEKHKEMYLINTIIPLIYWGGIFITYSTIGLKSFAIFKFIAFSVSAFSYLTILLNYLKLSYFEFVKIYIKPNLLPLVFIIFISFLIKNMLPIHHSKSGLLTVSVISSFIVVTSFIILSLTSTFFKEQCYKFLLYLKPLIHR